MSVDPPHEAGWYHYRHRVTPKFAGMAVEDVAAAALR